MRNELKLVGSRLRAERIKQGLTLDELATRSGMSTSTLSRLESGKRQANLELLVPLTRNLGVRIDDLLTYDVPDPRISRPMQDLGDMKVTPLAPEGSSVKTYKIKFLPVKKIPDLKVHDGYEWLYVVSGRLRLILGNQDLVLGPGEAAEFDTRVPHALFAEGRRAVEVISIFSETGFETHTT
ncbi:MAG: XRE family transcriptional regulator [Candidatus Nanopelagicales bacterium]